MAAGQPCQLQNVKSLTLIMTCVIGKCSDQNLTLTPRTNDDGTIVFEAPAVWFMKWDATQGTYVLVAAGIGSWPLQYRCTPTFKGVGLSIGPDNNGCTWDVSVE